MKDELRRRLALMLTEALQLESPDGRTNTETAHIIERFFKENLPAENRMVVADTSLRIGMIMGLMMGVSEDACLELIENKDGDFLYSRETEIVLEARRKWMKKE